jgi:AAA family ATP:ADP antiporter
VVARRTGLSAHVIRIWEKRYGAVEPERTGTNRRLYSDEQIERLSLLRDLTQAGHRIGHVAKLPTEKLRQLAKESDADDGRARRVMAAAPAAPDARGLARALGLFGEVRSHEATTVVVLALGLFLGLASHYVLKTVREPLVQATGGAMGKTWATAAQALVLLLLVPAYAWLTERVDRRRLVAGALVASVIAIEAFALLSHASVPYVGGAFYVFAGIYGLAVVAQLWSFANDVYATGDGQRLFPVIGIGATAGALAGSLGAKHLFASGIGVGAMMHVGAALVVLHLGAYALAWRRTERAATFPKPAAQGAALGFGLFLKSRHLRLVALLLVLLNLVNTTGEIVLAQAVNASADAAFAAASAADPSLVRDALVGARIGAFYGDFFFWVNGVALLLQALVASRIVRHAGLAGVLFALPIVALGAYGLAASGVALAVLRVVKIAENATDYSLMNTARAALFLPTSRAEKWSGKQTADTFFVRVGDLVSAGFVLVGTAVFALDGRGLAVANVLLVLAWLGVAWLLVREHRLLRARA